MSVLSYIQSQHLAGHPLLAVLLDPEKPASCEALFPHLNNVDLVLVGGSTGAECADFAGFIGLIRAHTTRPVVLFPGNVAQFTPTADALLFLSLLTARTPDVLIEPHIRAASAIRSSHIESIPMGYILIDGGHLSSVQRTTHSTPLPQTDIPAIVNTAIAGELLGKQLIYLEAGSGAQTPVAQSIIHAVREQISVPLIVGGGIGTTAQMTDAYQAGADIVVIGNHFEHHPEQLPAFIKAKNDYAAR